MSAPLCSGLFSEMRVISLPNVVLLNFDAFGNRINSDCGIAKCNLKKIHAVICDNHNNIVYTNMRMIQICEWLQISLIMRYIVMIRKSE